MAQLDPPHELLVCLAVERHGAQDWQQIAAATDPVLVALGYQSPSESLGPAQCEELFKTHSSSVGTAGALSQLVGELVARRTAYLTATSSALKAHLATGGGGADGGGDIAKARAGPSSVGRTRTAPAETLGPDAEGVESWVELAEEEKNPRRANVQGALLKFVQSVTKHKWAHPFKRPVTEKEAPDYKDIVKEPMDFSTLRKRVEGGAVRDMAAMVRDLELIFDNAMLYNPPAADYYKMAATLKEVVRQQMSLYSAWYVAKGVQPGSPFPPLDGSAADEAPTAAPSPQPAELPAQGPVEVAGVVQGAAMVQGTAPAEVEAPAEAEAEEGGGSEAGAETPAEATAEALAEAPAVPTPAEEQAPGAPESEPAEALAPTPTPVAGVAEVEEEPTGGSAPVRGGRKRVATASGGRRSAKR